MARVLRLVIMVPYILVTVVIRAGFTYKIALLLVVIAIGKFILVVLQLLVVAATNSVQALDKALIRPGRFDAKFTVDYPDFNERVQLINMYCAKKAFSKECESEKLAKMFEGYSCAKIETLLNKAAINATQNDRDEFTIEDIKEAVNNL